MNAITVTRHFTCAPDRLFSALTQQSQLVHWWGGAGVLLSEFVLQLDRPGDWSATVVNYKSGKFFTMSGEVVLVKPAEEVVLTWAWHDLNGQRQHESLVSLCVSPDTSSGTQSSVLTIKHEALPNRAIARSHEQGWIASVDKLSAYLGEKA